MTSVRRALAISFLERYLTVLLALASNMLLARLLTPHEIGVYSVSLAVIGIAQVLREFGIGNYLIQEKELTDDHLRTAFGMSLLLGGTLFAVVFVAAPYASRFYAEPAMTQTLRIAALNFLVLPLCTVRLALLRRAMRFKALLYISLVATVLSQVATVALAWGGLGPDSMAIGSVLLNAAMAVGTFVAHDDKRLLAPSLKLWRPLLNFGGQSALTNVVTSVSMDANDLVVGKVLGFGPVAMLSRAQGLMNLFHRDVMGAVRNVALPAFARAHRNGESMDRHLVKSISLVTVVAWLFYGWLSLFPLEATRILFGHQWDDAARLVPLFALAGALGAIVSLIPTVLIAVGRIDLVTRLELVLQPLRLALVALAAFAFASMEMVAAAMALSALLAVPCFLWAARSALNRVSLLRTATLELARSLLVSMVGLLPALLLAWTQGLARAEPIAMPLVLLSVLGGFVLALATAQWACHPITHEAAFVRLRSQLLPWMTRRAS